MVKKIGSRDIDDYTRGRVSELLKSDLSYRKIAKQCSISPSSVKNINFSEKNLGKTQKLRVGGKLKLSAAEIEYLEKCVTENRTIKITELAAKLNIHRNTVGKYLKILGFERKIATNKPLIIDFQRSRRAEWAAEMCNKSIGFWKRTIFSDESRFCQFNDSKKITVLRRKGERFADGCIMPTVRNNTSVMVWGAIFFGGRSKLMVFDKTVNSETYIECLKSALLPIYSDFPDRNFIFQDDGAPPHRSARTTDWKNMELLD